MNLFVGDIKGKDIFYGEQYFSPQIEGQIFTNA